MNLSARSSGPVNDRMVYVEPLLRMRNICKTYNVTGLRANDNVDFDVAKGEIHALVGENGAGKTTLMNILYGIESADSGDIFFNGEKVKINNAHAANSLGIGMVHQHFKLINEFTVAQNVVLGLEPRRRGLFFDQDAARDAVTRIIERNSFNVLPDDRIASLSVGQMQQVEIIKMLYRNAGLLILDEPTSVLTEQEIRKLFVTLRELIRRGKTIIIITHKLAEVKDISDRITVMRKGKVVDVKATADVDENEISRLMVGKSVFLNVQKDEGGCRETVLRLEDVSIDGKHQGRPVLDRISFEVSSFEIVGITGVAGNGLSELEDVVSGLQKPSGGRIFHDDEEITGLSPLDLRERGLAYVPADRLNRGASLETSVRENLIITSHHDFIRPGGVLDRDRIETYSSKLIHDYKIDGDPGAPIGTLSGGNIQKVILARELEHAADVVLFSEPTWGLDISSSSFIYEKILEMRNNGAAVVLISSNIDEILSLSDTVLVMYSGRIVTRRAAGPGLTRERIGEYMLGLRDDFRGDGIEE